MLVGQKRSMLEVVIKMPRFLPISIALSGSASDQLGTGGTTDPAAESSQADEFLDQHFGTTANLVIQLIARQGTVDSPEVARFDDEDRVGMEHLCALFMASLRA